MKLYFRYLAIHFKSQMQYKTSFFLVLTSQFFTAFSSFFAVWLLMRRFHTVAGFTFAEVQLCFAIAWMSSGLSECFFRGFDRFSAILLGGQLDRILVRPRGVILQVLSSQIDFTRLGRLAQGVCVLAWAMHSAKMPWTPPRVCLLAAMIVGGTAVFCGLYLLGASLCFFSVQSIELINIFTDGGRELAQYPLGVYGDALVRIFTFVVPLSLVQYYPLLYLVGRSGDWRYAMAPAAALPFAAVCYCVWRVGLAHYQSNGS